MITKTIITLALVGAIAIAIYFFARKLDFSAFNFKDGIQIPNPFENLFGTPDNSSALAGKTIIEEDGTAITIPDDNIINEDGTVEGSPPEITLNPETEKAVIKSIKQNRELAKRAEKAQQNLDKSTRPEYLEEITRVNKELSTPRDKDYFIATGFKGGAVSERIARTVVDSRNGKYRNNKTGQTVSYGGYSSAFEQEKKLRELFEKNQKKFPEYFGSALDVKTETVTKPIINQYFRGGQKVSKDEEDNIKKARSRQNRDRVSNRRQQKKTEELRNITTSDGAIAYLKSRGRR